MKYVLLVAFALCGCGEKSPPLPTTADMVTVPDPMDLSAAVPPDFAKPECLTTNGGLYNEYTTFFYRNVAGGPESPSGVQMSVAVKPDGTILRPMTPITGPSQWRCDSPMMASPVNCQAPCCAGDPSTVPLIYFTVNGWTLYRPGQCIWKDSNQITWSINVTNVSTARVN